MIRIGNQHHYQANPECPIYDELLGIVKKTLGVVDVIKLAAHYSLGFYLWFSRKR